MKRLIIFYFVFLISFSTYSQNNKFSDKANFRAIYKIKYFPDSTNHKSIRSENCLLLIGDNLSVFQTVNKIKFDSINSRGNIDFTADYPRTSFMYEIYKNRLGKKIVTIDKIGIKSYGYTENINILDWKILSDKKAIQGYNCSRATATYAGRIWEAWYTKEIPVSEGPYKFNGLPGLILEVRDTRNQYAFEIVNISFKTSTPIEFSDVGIPYTNRQDFMKSLDNYIKNYVTIRLSEGGPIYTTVEDMRRRAAEYYKRENNHLELK